MKKTSAVKLWLFVVAGFAGIVTAYFFAFKAVHAAQIREVPLVNREAHR